MPDTPDRTDRTDPATLAKILDRLGRDHLQQAQAAKRYPKGSPDWHRFEQGRWALKEAALVVVRCIGGDVNAIYDEWTDEWSPKR